nr:MAG TPA: hypothetical protein [Inoviridae sp.]
MDYVYLKVQDFSTKDNKKVYILSVLDVVNTVVQKIFLTQEQYNRITQMSFERFDDISSDISVRYDSKSNCYHLAFIG